MSELHLSRLLEQVRRTHGDETAVVGERSLTYAELLDRALRLANALGDLGVHRGDRLAVLMLNSHRFLELYYAAALSGIVIVPLNVRWGPAEFTHALSDCTPKVFALDRVVLGHLEPYLDALKGLGVAHFLYADEDAPAGMLAYERLVAEASARPLLTRPQEDDLYGLFYTSGTTGAPKGVMLAHKNLYANAYHAQIALDFFRGRADPGAPVVYLHAAPMFHLADGTTDFTVSWNGGAHAFIPRFEEETFFQAVERWRVNACVLVPTMISWLVNHPARDKYDLSSLETVLYGASPMPVEVLKKAMEVFGCRFQQGYGMTEAAPLVSALNAEEHEAALAGDRPERLASAGRPILGVEVRVVDEAGRDLPPGEIGEVWVRGPNLMQGYWNLPEATAEVLDEQGWYHTRDMGRFDADGYLYLVDRKDDMIISGGENVYSTEVEEVLYRHEAVLEAAVIGVPDPRWGEAVCAAVVLKEGTHVSAEALQAHCRQHLSPYKVPKRVEFLAELPKGGTGKVQKSALRQRFGALQEGCDG